MDVRFEFPDEIKRFAKKEGIKLNDVKKRIEFYLDVDLLDDKYNPIKCSKVKVVVNGLHKSNRKKVILKQNKISKKKPLTKVSTNMLLKDCSVYYLIYREK
jgi:hypothetical protein